ncbi:MAG: class I SAM-dependent methyltransferase [Actinobacteria bacterium]|nr:class I SAM-dependent methyltransferase [Actinomycetota bacterium]
MLVERNQAVFDGVASAYTDLALMGAERVMLHRLRDRLPQLEMLDLGVGSGRTGYTFAPLVRRYVGVDYSPHMIERARDLLGDDDDTELLVGDARDLSPIPGSFDFALFSFNGIDAVGHEDRLRILTEVRHKLNPGGLFLFSSHSLGALPLSARRRRGRNRSRLQPVQMFEFARDVRYGCYARRSNRELDLDDARQRGWTIVRDPAHRFSLDVYYVDPPTQLAQLAEAGLEPVAVIAESGEEVDPGASRRDAWLNYLCRLPG